jgi:hypothetical protein
MTRLAARLAAEARGGCWIVSNTFGLSDWRPLARHAVGDAFGGCVLVYRVAESAPPRQAPGAV